MDAKKQPEKDIHHRSGLFLSIGFVASLMIVISAFEFKSSVPIPLFKMENVIIVEEPVLIPVTAIDIPSPPPKPTLVNPRVKPEKIPVKIIERIKAIKNDLQDNVFIPEYDFIPTPPEPVEDAPFIIVEEYASFPGGFKAFTNYILENLKYPSIARISQTEGRVYIKFIIEKDGSISNPKVAKGISEACDREALRVLKGSPKWNPGRQRGLPVRQIMTLPIIFKLKS